MQSRLTIILDRNEKTALQKLSRYEYREIHKQAAVIIRDELIRRGLLQNSNPPPDPQRVPGDASRVPQPN